MSSSIKSTLLKGTITLTVTGILVKLLGFYNRIFLSNVIGAKEIGIYQLIFPVYLIVHCICCTGFELGITKFTAEEAAFGNRRNVINYLKTSFLFSFLLSLFCMGIIRSNADFFASILLRQKQCTICLQIIALSFPFISIKETILSFFYALKKTGQPAMCQFIEQCIRVLSIFFLSTVLVWFTKDASLAAYGLVAGEIASCMLSLCFLPNMVRYIKQITAYSKETVLPETIIIKRLLSYCIPLTLNRLLITLLSSVEAILIPYCLGRQLGNDSLALELYGILTGMAMSFITFPSALTNSLAMMLLPTISEAQAQKKRGLITRASTVSLHYCVLLGIFCTAVFLVFGKELGVLFFHNQTAGEFLFILSWLCPFIYIGTTFTSILNGLGKTNLTFFNNVIAILIRILSILAGIPLLGLKGYLIGLLLSYVTLCLLCVHHVKTCCPLHFSTRKALVLPGILALLGMAFSALGKLVLVQTGYPLFLSVSLAIALLTILYGGGSYLLRLQDI